MLGASRPVCTALRINGTLRESCKSVASHTNSLADLGCFGEVETEVPWKDVCFKCRCSNRPPEQVLSEAGRAAIACRQFRPRRTAQTRISYSHLQWSTMIYYVVLIFSNVFYVFWCTKKEGQTPPRVQTTLAWVMSARFKASRVWQGTSAIEPVLLLNQCLGPGPLGCKISQLNSDSHQDSFM